MTNEEIFSILRTKGKELSDWLKQNFDMHTAIVITSTEIKIVQECSEKNKEIKNGLQ